MKKRLEVEIELYGDGTIREQAPGSFVGGIPDPKLAGISFTIYDEASDQRPQSFEE